MSILSLNIFPLFHLTSAMMLKWENNNDNGELEVQYLQKYCWRGIYSSSEKSQANLKSVDCVTTRTSAVHQIFLLVIHTWYFITVGLANTWKIYVYWYKCLTLHINFFTSAIFLYEQIDCSDSCLIYFRVQTLYNTSVDWNKFG